MGTFIQQQVYLLLLPLKLSTSSSTSHYKTTVKSTTTMALRIIYPAYQPMDTISPLLGDMNCSFRPIMRKRRRMINSDFIDKVFSDMFLPSYEACAKTNNSGFNKENPSKDETPDRFSKTVHLKDFKPEDIQIRVTTDKKVIVEAKQEVKEEKGGFKSYKLKEIKQSLDVPDNVNIEELTSSLSEQGYLTISAPLLALPEPKKKEETKLHVTFDEEKNNKENDEDQKNTDDEKAI